MKLYPRRNNGGKRGTGYLGRENPPAGGKTGKRRKERGDDGSKFARQNFLNVTTSKSNLSCAKKHALRGAGCP